MNANVFDEFAKTFDKLMPKGAAEMRADVERNVKAALQSALGNLDVVTREEFDIQAKVLARTREKLEALEGRVAALEGAAQGSTSDVSTSAGNDGGPEPTSGA